MSLSFYLFLSFSVCSSLIDSEPVNEETFLFGAADLCPVRRWLWTTTLIYYCAMASLTGMTIRVSFGGSSGLILFNSPLFDNIY